MKFLLVVLAIHFAAEVINKKRYRTGNNNDGMTNNTIYHPAEFNLR